ncbi:uncharacterized protein [Ptychodera flava]|uniref:uncharacterized protein n=1 Tax=Ptychodera flava TaxID=63121 RepID=UPI00396A695C
MELDRDLRIRHDSAGDLPSDVVTDGGNEVDSNQYYYIIDGLRPGIILIPAADLSSEEEYKPFKDRSEKEKEKLYEKIAARLSAIGDRVAVDHSLAAEFDDGLGAVGGESDAEKKRIEIEQPDGNFEKEEEPLNFTENDARMLGLRLRDHGDRRSSSEVFSIPLNVLMSVVRNTAYDSFKDVAQTVIGQDTSWKELALVLRLTRDAIKIAGYTPGVVRKIKDNTLSLSVTDLPSGLVAREAGVLA